MPLIEVNEAVQGSVYSNADYAFANSVITDIRRNHRMPLNITQEDVFNAILNQIDWWYEKCPYATADDQLCFDISLLGRAEQLLDPDNEAYQLLTNSLIMPGKVRAIYELFYLGTGYMSRSSFSFAKWQLESLLMSSSSGLQPNYGSDIYMASVFATNLLASMGKEPVMFDYDRLTKILRVYDSGSKTGTIMCKVCRDLPLSALYNDLWFRRFIISHVLDGLADHLELFGSELPGNLAINIAVLRNRSEKLMTEVTDYIQADSDSDIIIIKT
jgi:hypothetical protein